MDIRLTLLARQDLEYLRRFTIDTWGQEQWRRYFAGIVLAFERVARDGRCGRPRSNLRYGMRSLPYQKHLIFFEPIDHAEGEIVILRIVHQSRNLAALAYRDQAEG